MHTSQVSARWARRGPLAHVTQKVGVAARAAPTLISYASQGKTVLIQIRIQQVSSTTSRSAPKRLQTNVDPLFSNLQNYNGWPGGQQGATSIQGASQAACLRLKYNAAQQHEQPQRSAQGRPRRRLSQASAMRDRAKTRRQPRVSRQHRRRATVHLSRLQGRSRPRDRTELPGVRKQCRAHQSTRFRHAPEVDVLLCVTVVSGGTRPLCAPPAMSASLATSRKAAAGGPTGDGTVFTESAASPTAAIETAGAPDVQLGGVQDE
ncbi:hypothetical protein NDU88_002561 [Pleurodeles waltl]|uniref:Uncharacterized protein n=1 Tax=Pleurodeles waltl TaxID=8319 RepID=A0AAV7WQJ8_PLEWA|nr:hypothetical protein NDU88_002561 [Pleurodeles waltl]